LIGAACRQGVAHGARVFRQRLASMRFGQRRIPINFRSSATAHGVGGVFLLRPISTRFSQIPTSPLSSPACRSPGEESASGLFLLTTATCVDEQGSFSSLFVPLDDPRALPETRRSFAPILLKLALDAGASGFLNLSQSRDRPLMQIARAVSLGSSLILLGMAHYMGVRPQVGSWATPGLMCVGASSTCC
jgi:hypothetical protein